MRLSALKGLLGDGSVRGLKQFTGEQTLAQMYTTIIETEPPVTSVPYPSIKVQPVNLPLHLVLSRLVSGVITDDGLPDRWYIATSLVQNDTLEFIFPTNQVTSSWQMAGIDYTLRESLCKLLRCYGCPSKRSTRL